MVFMVTLFSARAEQPNTAGNQISHVERAHKILGKEIKNGRGDDIGKISDLVVDLESGRLLYAIVDVNGGVPGGNRVTIPPGKFSTDSANNLIVKVDKANLASAPHFDKNRAAELNSVNFVREVYQHFDQQPWWENPGSTSSRNFGNVHLVSQLMGMDVKTVSNENLGKVKNLVVDVPAGRVLYVVFSPAGDLGANDTVYLMPPNAFTVGQDTKTLVTGVEKGKLQGAPHFSSNQWPDVTNSSYASKIYQYYGKQPYF
jgi:sporulation protein YlmC with PRC-barrel domain